MKCSKCNSELKPGAKFCTGCGTQVERGNSTEGVAICPNCNSGLNPNAKFCTSCGHSMVDTASKGGEISTIDKRIFWNIQQGEVARRINETEMAQYDSAQGVIINEGTIAHIRSKGKLLAEINGGIYDFVDTTEVNKILESRVGGAAEGVKRGFKAILNAIFGKKVKDNVYDSTNDPKRQNSVEDVIRSMRDGDALSLTLMLNKNFELVLGQQQASLDGYSEFTPLTVKTKYLDVNIGLRAIFKISNFESFATQYLSDRASVSTSFIADLIAPAIKSALTEELFDVEVSEQRIPEDVKAKIERKVIDIVNKSVHGVAVVRIEDISVADEDLERFRTLSRELYLSERELDYLVRSNDFKNRLNLHVDEQEVFDAQREVNKEKKLLEVNKDNLLSRDEFNKFLEVMELEGNIRRAKSDDELAAVEAEMASKQFDRDQLLFMKQQRAIAEVEELNLERMRKVRLGEAQIDVDESRIRDDYEDERKERERERIKKMADDSLERMGKLKALEREDADAQHRRDMESQESQQEHEKGMSWEQLLASRNTMSSDTATALAQNDAKQQKEYYDKLDEMNRDRMQEMRSNKDAEAERMMEQTRNMQRMAESMMAMSADIANNRNGTPTSVNTPPPPPAMGAAYFVHVTGRENVQHTHAQVVELINSGVVTSSTNIYSTAVNNWLLVSQLNEFANYFSRATPPPPPMAPKGVKACSNCNSSMGIDDIFCESCGTRN